MADRVGVAIIGVGGIVLNEHMKHLSAMSDVTFVGYLHNKSGRAAQAAQEYGGRVFDTIDDLLDDPKVQAVYLSVPPYAHGEIESKVIRAGKALFIEKPLGTKLETALEVGQQVEEARAIVAVGYHWRYQSTTAELRRRMAGVPVVGATGWWCGGRPDVWWWRDKATSGGQPTEQTTHIFDLANYLIDADPVCVLATGRQLGVFADDPKHTVDDVSLAQVHYANGAAISVWSSDVMTGPAARISLEIYGIDRRYEIGLKTMKCWEKSGCSEIPHEGSAYFRENEAFIQAVRTGDPSGLLATYETSLVTHRVTMAVERSIRSGKMETV
ncbi:MAG TPA: Gfo/Idh/MocA family oxidoreductase [Tepidisphaeraceae bacterium]|jgi:predicted dehydrogenase|nr:Gfo/Idh/MocA family oxidoreductase [Tepidisphaeraceae bacterium]